MNKNAEELGTYPVALIHFEMGGVQCSASVDACPFCGTPLFKWDPYDRKIVPKSHYIGSCDSRMFTHVGEFSNFNVEYEVVKDIAGHLWVFRSDEDRCRVKPVTAVVISSILGDVETTVKSTLDNIASIKSKLEE